jgi:hypothetical protein
MGQTREVVINFNPHITVIIEDNKMPQTVQISVTLTINPPAPPPLVASPSSVTLPAETVGMAVSAVPVAQITGGTGPYLAPVIDPASPSALPPGLTAAIDGSGNVTISGTPSVAGTGTFVLDVTDSGA